MEIFQNEAVVTAIVALVMAVLGGLGGAAKRDHTIRKDEGNDYDGTLLGSKKHK
jgi:hypothetical protein